MSKVVNTLLAGEEETVLGGWSPVQVLEAFANGTNLDWKVRMGFPIHHFPTSPLSTANLGGG